jgi:hypothetical protein
VQARVVHAEAGDGLGGGAGPGVGEVAAGGGPSPERGFERGGHVGEAEERGAAYAADGAPREGGVDCHEGLVAGLRTEEVDEGAGGCGEAQAPAGEDLAGGEGRPVHADAARLPAVPPGGELRVGEDQGLGLLRVVAECLDTPEAAAVP